MTLVSLIVFLIIIGLLLYLVNMLPIDGTIKNIIYVVVIVFVIIWLLQNLGLLGSLETIRIR